MRSADKLRLRARSLFRRPQVEAELSAELAFHLDQLVAQNVAAGMPFREARHAALRAFGGVTQIQERCREMRRTRYLEDLGRDLGYAVRTLLARPVFTLVAALSLALGIGANTAIFSLIHALLLRPLPVHEPDRLAVVGDPSRVGGVSEGSIRTDLVSLPFYREIRDHNRVFSEVFASGRSGRLKVGIDGAPPAPGSVRGRLVSGNYFSTLGVAAARGRTFTSAEDQAPGASPVVVISHDFWTKRFSQDPGVVGHHLSINGSPFTVIGVMPEGFFGEIVGTPTELWVPIAMQRQVNPGRDYLERWDTSWLLLMGRLKPGVSLPRAKADVETLLQRVVTTRAGGAISADSIPSGDKLHAQVSTGRAGFSWVRNQYSQPLFVLMVLVGLVLAIACANVANLLLERATGRQKEIAVRLALGAGRGRLVRQLLTESLLLAALGGALGLLLALWAGPALLRLAGGGTAIPLDLGPDLTILAFTAVIALSTGLVFGLAPAMRATRVELTATLKDNARSVTGWGTPKRWPLGKLLVVAQFALSLLLLTGAGLFVRTLRNLQSLDLGFDRAHLVMLSVDPVAAGYSGARIQTFPFQLAERLRALPGVTAVSYSENGIFSGTESSTTAGIEGFKLASDPDAPELAYDHVGPGYFETIGLPLVLGRGVSSHDTAGAPRVAVINETLARQFFTGSPIGKHITIGGNLPDEVEIVGVARPARDHDLRATVPPRFYLPAAQEPEPISAYNFEIRTRRPAALVQAVREAVTAFDAGLPIGNLGTLSDSIDESIDHERMIAKLSMALGFLALLLAAIGLYGVISYTISRRTNEIGLRMALGAGRRDVLGMVMRETLLLAFAGVALGVPAALTAARLVESRLFGLSAHDPATLTAATGILVVVALFAGTVPGTRATQVNPTEALRYG